METDRPDQVEPSRSTTARALRETRFYAGTLAFFVVCGAFAFALIVVAAALIPGWFTVFITSDSMAPAIKRGDVVIGATAAPVETGRVIVFEDPSGTGLITHRVIGIDPDGRYMTAGDANAATDSTSVDPARVQGSARFVVPLVGWPLVWLADGSWPHLIALALAVALIIGMARYGLLDRYAPWGDAAAPQMP